MPRMMTISKAAETVGIAAHSLRRWIRAGEYKGYVKSGNKYLINLDMLNDFLMGGSDGRSS